MNYVSGTVMILYVIGVFVIGIISGKGGSDSEASYYTGNKGFGPIPTAISAGATNSSGWIYIGACGFAYQVGVYSMWMLVGFGIGALIDMFFIAPKLRHQGHKLEALNIAEYLEKRLQSEWNVSKKSHIVRIIAASLLVLFFVPYMSAQLTATGKTIQTLINIDYNIGLVLGAVFVVGYCYFGGYSSVIYTDMVQGIIMLGVFVFAPIFIIFSLLGGWTSFWTQLIAIDPNLATYANGAVGKSTIALILGWIFYGIGEIGQPHIQQRFLTAKNDKTIQQSTYLYLGWIIIVMMGSNLLGLCGRIILPNLVDPEYVFPSMIIEIAHPAVTGIVIAAIFSAIASTYSSQLMVAVQSVSSDLLHSFSSKKFTQKELVKIGQITMIVMGVLSTSLALLNVDSVFRLVNYAWSATASAFGPMLLYLLGKPKLCNKEAAIVALIVGAIVPTVWYAVGLSSIIHEIAPGILVTGILIPIVTNLTKHKYININNEGNIM